MRSTRSFYLSFPLSLFLYLSCLFITQVTCASLSIPAYCIAATQAHQRGGKFRRSPSFSTIPALQARQNPSGHSRSIKKDNVDLPSQAPNDIIPRGNGICYYLNSGSPIKQGVTSLPFILPAGRYALKFIKVPNPSTIILPFFVEVLRVDPALRQIFSVAAIHNYGDTFLSDGIAALELLLRPWGWEMPGTLLELEVWVQAVS